MTFSDNEDNQSDAQDPSTSGSGELKPIAESRPARRNGYAPGREGGLGMAYRANDYRSLDYRGMDYRGIDPVSMGGEGQIDWIAALWRYKFALILPTLLGLAAAGALFTTRPNVYRSTARLVVESERPWVPESDPNEPVRSVPPAELLLMQLRSEKVLDYATRHPLFVDTLVDLSPAELKGILVENVEFEDAMQKSRSDRAIAFFLHFDSEDPQFAVSAVTALSDGLQYFFAEKSETSVSELKKLITTAKDKLLPELNSLEAEYRAFRESSELSWDKNGTVMNPYREKQLNLQARRLVLEDDMRNLATKLLAITSTIESSQDPLLVMEVVQQLLGEELFAVKQLLAAEEPNDSNATRDEDLALAKLAIERELVPLEIERSQFASQFGTGHPSVRQFDLQITATREKLNEVSAQETRRIAELRREGDSPSGELLKLRRQRAELAVSGFVRAMETNRAVLESQISQLDKQIDSLNDRATKLVRAESENAMYLRRIDRAQKLFDGVEEQMTKINLSDQDTALHVSQLNAASAPMIVSPILIKFLAIGGLLGGLAGMGLVYLLESQAKTYHSSEEIAATLGMRVLSHVPTDNHKLPRAAKGEVYPYRDIDAGFSTLHRPRSVTAEAVRGLRTAVFFDSNTIDAKIIQITSPLPEDGKSTLAGNLAISIARSGKQVVIVDADMRRPQMTSSFGLGDRTGLTELIDGTCDPSQVVYSTPVENLSIVPCGPIPANPAEALSMPQFGEFLLWLRDRFDYVIIDTPPLLVVTDPSIVASVVDGIVFAFRVRRGCRPQTKEAVAMLRATGTPIFGCVVNRVDHNTSATGYRGYQSSSYYGRRYTNFTPDKSAPAAGENRPKGYVVSPAKATNTTPAKSS